MRNVIFKDELGLDFSLICVSSKTRTMIFSKVGIVEFVPISDQYHHPKVARINLRPFAPLQHPQWF
jgi:hypothetical protein